MRQYRERNGITREVVNISRRCLSECDAPRRRFRHNETVPVPQIDSIIRPIVCIPTRLHMKKAMAEATIV